MGRTLSLIQVECELLRQGMLDAQHVCVGGKRQRAIPVPHNSVR
jgi:hypothetical protein